MIIWTSKKYDIMQLTFYMGSFNKKAIQKKKKKKYDHVTTTCSNTCNK